MKGKKYNELMGTDIHNRRLYTIRWQASIHAGTICQSAESKLYEKTHYLATSRLLVARYALKKVVCLLSRMKLDASKGMHNDDKFWEEGMRTRKYRDVFDGRVFAKGQTGDILQYWSL